MRGPSGVRSDLRFEGRRPKLATLRWRHSVERRQVVHAHQSGDRCLHPDTTGATSARAWRSKRSLAGSATVEPTSSLGHGPAPFRHGFGDAFWEAVSLGLFRRGEHVRTLFVESWDALGETFGFPMPERLSTAAVLDYDRGCGVVT